MIERASPIALKKGGHWAGVLRVSVVASSLTNVRDIHSMFLSQN